MTTDAHSDNRPWWLRFLLPRFTTAFAIRLALLAAAAWLFFSRICIPARINGDSMLPNYHTGQWLFCWTPTFRHTPPQAGDVVMIEYSGRSIMLLKRVVATEDDKIQFVGGRLLVNDSEVTAPWAHATPCDWETPPIVVRPGCVYVVGDNRQMPVGEHLHGEVDIADIVGAPLGAR